MWASSPLGYKAVTRTRCSSVPAPGRLALESIFHAAPPPFLFKVIVNLKSGLGQNTGKHGFCDCAMWVTLGVFLNFHFPHTWPVLQVHLRFNLKSVSFIPSSAILSWAENFFYQLKEWYNVEGAVSPSVTGLQCTGRILLSGDCSQFDQMRLERSVYKRQPSSQYALGSLPHGLVFKTPQCSLDLSEATDCCLRYLFLEVRVTK